MNISFKTKEHPETVTVQYDLPTTLADLVGKFGEESVANAARGAFVISLQAFGRRHIGKSVEEIQGLITGWNPNERAPAVKQTAFERASGLLGQLSADEKRELLNKIRAQNATQAA